MSIIKLYDKKDYKYLNLKMPKYNYKIQIGENYLGGYLNAKKPRKNETWIRGNDLSDGKKTEETLLKIFKDIVKHESD